MLHIKKAANLAQSLNFKANFHQELELFPPPPNFFTNNGRHFKIVSILKNIKFVDTRPHNFKK